MIVVVSDIFSEQMLGGAELTTDALLENGFDNYKKINSTQLTSEIIDDLKEKKWIFFNFFGVSDKNIFDIIKKVKNYSVVEYDYKYCIYRLKTKHEHLENECHCEKTSRGKLIALFLAKSKNLFFMSKGQKEEYENVFPILKKHQSSSVLSSSFTDENLQYILSLNTEDKNNKYIILNSDSWVKGKNKCIEYAKNNGVDYELVSGLSHRELLKKLSTSKGLIFLPNGYDTCPRIVIEAKLLDCDIIINDNVQHKEEEWFQNKETISTYVKKQKQEFYERCLKNKLIYDIKEESTRFVFIMPGYNVAEWLPKCINSIKKQNYDNYLAVFIDDLSDDESYKIFKNLTKDDKRFFGIKNKEKKYALKNIQDGIESLDLKDNDVIILLDSDDWLSSASVLNYLNDFYIKNSCLSTYGSYMYYPYGFVGLEPSSYSNDVIKQNRYREDEWRASHLRTFKKKIWDKIKKEDFIDSDGNYYKMAYDQAIMLPILEMTGPKSMYIEEVLHVYNIANSLNVSKIKEKEQYETMRRIRKKARYERLHYEN